MPGRNFKILFCIFNFSEKLCTGLIVKNMVDSDVESFEVEEIRNKRTNKKGIVGVLKFKSELSSHF